MRQVRAGRVVMSLDSTDLLNRRHIRESVKDGKLLTKYPDINERELEFGDIIIYRNALSKRSREILRRECSEDGDADVVINKTADLKEDGMTDTRAEVEKGVINNRAEVEKGVINNRAEVEKDEVKEAEVGSLSDSVWTGSNDSACGVEDTTIVIVTYGNGVPTSLEAIDRYYETISLPLSSSSSSSSESISSHCLSPDEFHTSSTSSTQSKWSNREIISLVDCPCISTFPTQLSKFLQSCPSLHSVIFADVCKLNAGMPLSMFAITLQNEGMFASQKNITWLAIGGANTYNPLGGTLTFLNSDDVTDAINIMIDRKKEATERK